MAEIHVSGQGGGVIQGTASEAVLVVLLAARDQVLRRVGKDATGRLVVYCSDQTHSALQKACKVELFLIFYATGENVLQYPRTQYSFKSYRIYKYMMPL